MRLVGFRGQLAAIDRLVEQVAAGAGGRLVITGPPGAGKSALLTAAAKAAAGRGLAVVRLTGADGPETAEAAAETGPRLLLIDDIDTCARCWPRRARRFRRSTSSRAGPAWPRRPRIHCSTAPPATPTGSG